MTPNMRETMDWLRANGFMCAATCAHCRKVSTMADFTDDQKLEISNAFSRGNYANAYECTNLDEYEEDLHVASMIGMANTQTSNQALTAWTITEKQIREMADRALGHGYDQDHVVGSLCYLALHDEGEAADYPTSEQRMKARARLAAILNEREGR